MFLEGIYRVWLDVVNLFIKKRKEDAVAQLNYHHLYYFYVTAKQGGVSSASKVLHITPQTVSGQISALEAYLGVELFERSGKKLLLNEHGRLAYSYAEDIFSLGEELLGNLLGERPGYKLSLRIGITDVIPKVLAYDLLKELLRQETTELICKEGDLDSLLIGMATNSVDLILSDRPATPGTKVRAYNHLLGESGLSFLAKKTLSKKLSENFPQCLHHQPFLMHGDRSTLKQSLSAWFKQKGIAPNIVAEFDDSALLKHFGQGGFGVFVAPTCVEGFVKKEFDLGVVGRTSDITERFYVISPERKVERLELIELQQQAAKIFKNA